jgi:hypothetical protein
MMKSSCRVKNDIGRPLLNEIKTQKGSPCSQEMIVVNPLIYGTFGGTQPVTQPFLREMALVDLFEKAYVSFIMKGIER